MPMQRIEKTDADTERERAAEAALEYAAFLRAEIEAERAFEMRAAFGPGVEVVNVLTGERFRT